MMTMEIIWVGEAGKNVVCMCVSVRESAKRQELSRQGEPRTLCRAEQFMSNIWMDAKAFHGGTFAFRYSLYFSCFY